MNSALEPSCCQSVTAFQMDLVYMGVTTSTVTSRCQCATINPLVTLHLSHERCDPVRMSVITETLPRAQQKQEDICKLKNLKTEMLAAVLFLPLQLSSDAEVQQATTMTCHILVP